MATTVFPNYLTTVSVSDKADKVASATSGHVAGLDGNGNLTDSGHALSEYTTKVASATSGNFASLDENGNLTDSGHKHSDYLTSSTSFVKNNATPQTINGGSATELNLACSTSGNTAKIRADSEGGNIQVKQGNNLAEFDSQPLNDAGTGYARIFVKTGNNTAKEFKFRQNGGFEDAHGNSTAIIASNKADQNTIAIKQLGNTADQNIAKGKYVVWGGTLYIATSAIASGDTLASGTNLTEISDGGMNDFASNLTLKAYSGTTGTSLFQDMYYADISVSTDESSYGTIIGFYIDNVGNNHPAYSQRLANGSIRVYSPSSEKTFTLQVLFSKRIVKV